AHRRHCIMPPRDTFATSPTYSSLALADCSPRYVAWPCFFSSLLPPPPRSPLFPYTTLFRSILRTTGSLDLGPGTDERAAALAERSEEHTSELQSPCNLVCRLLLEKKKLHVYLEERFDFKAPERTTAEFMLDLQKTTLLSSDP